MRLVRFWSSGPKSEQHKERQQSAAVDMGLEGLVSKRRDRPYQQVEALGEGEEPEASGDEPGLGRVLDQIRFGYFDFAHIVVVEELVLAVVPFDLHARPIAGTYRALIVRAVMPSNALADVETFGLGWSHCVHCQPTV
jgi:hypothetical protein